MNVNDLTRTHTIPSHISLVLQHNIADHHSRARNSELTHERSEKRRSRHPGIQQGQIPAEEE